MHTKTAADVMTRDVVTAETTTPFKDLVDLMVGEQVSALPVIDRRGTLLGVVSEADLLCREAHADDTRHRRARARQRKATGLTAGDVMTAPALTVDRDATLPHVARELARTGVRRLCVVDGGRLVGVVARRDVLRPFLRGDRDIEREIETDVFGRALRARAGSARVSVEDGVALLLGRLEYHGDVTTATRLARQVPGVVEVRNRLDWQWDGDGPPSRAPAASGS